MTRDDIRRLSSETGICRLVRPQRHEDMTDMLERFAALVAAAEREACAKACEDVGNRDANTHAWDAAAAIRARKEMK